MIFCKPYTLLSEVNHDKLVVITTTTECHHSCSKVVFMVMLELNVIPLTFGIRVFFALEPSLGVSIAGHSEAYISGATYTPLSQPLPVTVPSTT